MRLILVVAVVLFVAASVTTSVSAGNELPDPRIIPGDGDGVGGFKDSELEKPATAEVKTVAETRVRDQNRLTTERVYWRELSQYVYLWYYPVAVK
ncbi:MAG: hypothetical protein JSW58_09405 [Candidatus Latescibacterota bacterium]|nr:MAG: hypothetical protein JSW58_09405 [Candidatus Latescibacterota bacterium]